MVVVLVGCNNTKSRVNDKENINENDNSEDIVKIMESVYLDYLYDIYIQIKKDTWVKLLKQKVCLLRRIVKIHLNIMYID